MSTIANLSYFKKRLTCCKRAITVLLSTLLLSQLTLIPSAAFGPSREYYFFPYEACIRCTVESSEVANKKNSKQPPVTEMAVVISDVLRGSFTKGQRLTLHFEGLPSEILSSNKPVNSRGKDCVIAFNSFSPRHGIQSIWHVYAPFPGQKFTSADVAKLKTKLPIAAFSREKCIEVKLQEVRHSKSDRNQIEIVAELESSSLEGRHSDFKVIPTNRRKKANFILAYSSNSCLPNMPDNQLKGKHCFWIFDQYEYDGKTYTIHEAESPFRQRDFTETDIARFKRQWAAAAANIKFIHVALQRYLEQRWPIARIKDMCRPELCYISSHQNLVAAGSTVLKGQLWPAQQKEVGEVTWYCVVNNGVSHEYSINVKKASENNSGGLYSYWGLEIATPKLIPQQSDDEFLLERLLRTLSHCASAAMDLKRTKDPAFTLTITPTPDSKPRLMRDKNLQVTGMEWSLVGGGKFVAYLDQNQSIKSVEINGKISEEWTQAIYNGPRNIEALNRRFNGS
jgi:hypothetical protein